MTYEQAVEKFLIAHSKTSLMIFNTLILLNAEMN
jgi:hypothetical protein